MDIIDNIAEHVEKGGNLKSLLRHQQSYHEARRWSTDNLFDRLSPEKITNRDRAALWHAARAEITTQPAGLRLAVLGTRLANEFRDENPAAATVLDAAAAWSARYWLEEEAHHEVAFGKLMEAAGLPPIPEDDVVAHRQFFPDDNYLRVCLLQACVETEASVTYGEMAKTSQDPLVRELFLSIMRDEVQHRRYFIAFAKALVDTKAYPIKDAFSIVYTWLRPEHGETYGSKREKQTQHDGFVNWWEHLKDEDDQLALETGQIHSKHLQSKKQRSLMAALEAITGIKVRTFQELQKTYFEMLKNASTNRARPAVAQ